MPSILRLQKVGKVFANGTRALDRIDLSIRQGEFVSIVGPSGCGKSTLLRLISDLSEPSEGTIAWADDEIRNGDIGFVFQDATLLPWASIFDNVYLPLKLAGLPRDQAGTRIEEVLEMVGLEGQGGLLPREASGGMRMRVSIARALVTQPKLLLLDEPFAALDEITRFKLNDDLLRLWQDRNLTVLFVTHSVFESAFLANRIVVMAAKPGRIVADVPVTFDAPRTPDLRTSAEFAAMCRTVSTHLADAMAA